MFEITKLNIQKTITSLRGISILGVLLYHAKFDFFKGGYLGVDVFFVISGYLIGNIILSKLTTQTFFFKDFYIRRARRLLPALFASLFFTYVLNYFLPYHLILNNSKFNCLRVNLYWKYILLE